MKVIKIGIPVLLVVLLAALFLGNSVYRVPEGHQGLVLTFGQITDTKLPGLYMRVPFAQKVVTVSTSSINTVELGYRTERSGTSEANEPAYSDVMEELLMLTGDGNLVKVEAIAQYVVSDPAAYLYNASDPQQTMQLVFETILRRNVQSKNLDDALRAKATIEQETLPDIQRAFNNYGLGVQVREVRIQNITVPAEVEAAYEDVNNAQNEKTRRLDEAQRYQNQVLPAARAKAYKLIEDAKAYQSQTISQAEGDVAAFEALLQRYTAAKEITRERLKIETFEHIMQNAGQKFILSASDNTIRFLPLETTRPAATQTPAPVRTPEPQATPTPAPEATPTP